MAHHTNDPKQRWCTSQPLISLLLLPSFAEKLNDLAALPRIILDLLYTAYEEDCPEKARLIDDLIGMAAQQSNFGAGLYCGRLNRESRILDRFLKYCLTDLLSNNPSDHHHEFPDKLYTGLAKTSGENICYWDAVDLRSTKRSERSGGQAKLFTGLPPNYIFRRQVLHDLKERILATVIQSRNSLESTGAKWIVLRGGTGSGKSTTLTAMLSSVEIQKIFDSVTVTRLFDDSSVEDELGDLLASRRSADVTDQTTLLVIDNNTSEWETEITKYVRYLSCYFTCIVTTTQDLSCVSGAGTKPFYSNMPAGLNYTETSTFFETFFDCEVKSCLTLQNVVNDIYQQCGGMPLRIRILCSMARSLGLCTSSRAKKDKLHSFYNGLRNQGVLCYGQNDDLTDTETDEGWSIVQTKLVSPVPEYASVQSTDFFERVSVSDRSDKKKQYNINSGTLKGQSRSVAAYPLQRQNITMPTKSNFPRANSVLQGITAASTSSSFPSQSVADRRSLFPYTIHNMVGEGRSRVYRGMRTDSDQAIAVKELKIAGDIDLMQETNMAINEFDSISKLEHKNIIRYFDLEIKYQDRLVYLLMEYCDGGSLKRTAQNGFCLELSRTKHYLRQLLEGLCYLHDQNICHLDLKSENVFLTNTDQIKIGDFGEMAKLEKKVNVQEDPVARLVGTVQYMSPEMITRDQHISLIGQPSDVWSFGCVALELLTGKTPKFRKTGTDGQSIELHDITPIMFYVGNGNRPHVPSKTDFLAKELLGKCFKQHYASRATAAELLQHQFIAVVL